jgi:hypothetical protein
MSDHNPLIPNSFQTPNIYVDDFMAFVTEAEYKVLSYAARRIFGFGKPSDRISLSQFVDGIETKSGMRLDYGTGLSKNTVRTCLDSLKEFGLIIELSPGNPLTNEAAEYTLPTDITKVDFEGLKSRKQQDKKKRARIAPKPVSIGDTGYSRDMKPISNGDTALYQTVIQPYIANCTSPISNGDTTKPSRNPVETKGNSVVGLTPQPPPDVQHIPKPKKQPAPFMDNEFVKAYINRFHLTPNHKQRQAIVTTVTNLLIWQKVFDIWEFNKGGYNPQKLGDMLDRYKQEVEHYEQRRKQQSNYTLTAKASGFSGAYPPRTSGNAGANAYIERLKQQGKLATAD